jgi:hypothetical protein
MAVLVFIGASVWEGSAAVSVAGELPEGAYYVATNSFPRNTVVDVTNLENGRTIRVIVAAGLDSPGLLAMLSRNVATAIGLPVRGIGRIRMSQPSDPVAFSRFTEESELSGDRDPRAAAPAAAISPALRTATAGDLASATPEDRFYNSIINRPEDYAPPPVAYPQDGSVLMEPRPVWISEDADAAPVIAETQDPAAAPLLYEPPLVAVPGPDPGYPQPALVAPYPNSSLGSTPYAWQTSPPYLAPPAEAPAFPRDSVITLEPAGERPPYGSVDIASARELPPSPPRQAHPEAGDDTYLDPRYFIGPIPRPAAPTQPPARVVNPPPIAAPAPSRAAPPASGGAMLSVPVIAGFEAGKQYVQIGAFTRTDTLESAISRANRSYPLVIQADSSRVYRLLIGPLNPGESAAVLRRVRSDGFPDAFIRRSP